VHAEILAAFLDAVRQVLSETGVEIESIVPEEDRDTDDQVITSIGLTGGVRGIFILRTDTSSARNIIRAMLGEVRIALGGEGLDRIQMAALGELSNQICGRAITLLSETTAHCDITPPAVVAAQGMKSLVPDALSSSRREVRGPFGRISLFLGVQEGPRKRRRRKEKNG